MIGWMWGVVGGIIGTAVGVAGAVLGVWNGRRIARGEESFLKMKRWNMCDSFYTFLITAGLLCLIGGLLSIHLEIMDDGFALCLFSLGFFNVGCLNAILRVRALQTYSNELT
jgi:hypothetical protein